MAIITTRLYIDGISAHTGTLFATIERAAVRYPLPPGLRGREFRLNMTSPSRFQVWDALGWLRPLNTDIAWQRRGMTTRVTGQVLRNLLAPG